MTYLFPENLKYADTHEYVKKEGDLLEKKGVYHKLVLLQTLD